MFKERKLRHEMRGKICFTNGLMENVLLPVAQLVWLDWCGSFHKLSLAQCGRSTKRFSFLSVAHNDLGILVHLEHHFL